MSFPDLVRALGSLDCNIGAMLSELSSGSLEDYSIKLCEAAQRCTPTSTLYRDLIARYSGTADTPGIRDNLERFPLIQTGFHSQLLLDPISYYTYALFSSGLANMGARYCINYSCSTNSLQNKKGVGPGWLDAGSSTVNVFGLSRKKLDDLTVCLPKGEVWDFDNLLSNSDPDLRKLAHILSGVRGTTAEAVFNKANVKLSQLISQRIEGVFFGENAVCDILAELILRDDPVVSSLLFDSHVRNDIVGAVRSWNSRSVSAILPFGTELFWIRKGSKLKNAMIIADRIQAVSGPQDGSFSLNKFDIVNAIESRALVPSLFLTFTIVGILPRITVLGGHRQIFYFPIIHKTIMNALAKARFHPPSELNDMIGDPLHGWIVGLYFSNDNPLRKLCSGILESEFQAIRGSRLRDSVESFPIPSVDPTWASLVGMIR